jgi:uncharacterized membrane protein YtjA (UPF0391 family)
VRRPVAILVLCVVAGLIGVPAVGGQAAGRAPLVFDAVAMGAPVRINVVAPAVVPIVVDVGWGSPR